MSDAQDPVRVEELFRRGDLPAARAAAETALSGRPDHAPLRRLLGLICCHAGDLEAGARHLRAALDGNAADLEARTALAYALAAGGNSDEALALCAGRAEHPLVRLRAHLLQERRDFIEAAQSYEAVVAAEPRDWESWNNLGNARRESGDPVGAVAALQRAQALAPGVAAVGLNLAMAAVAAGDLEFAERAFAAAALIEPENLSVQFELGKLLGRLGRTGEAAAALERASASPEAGVEALLELGRLHSSARGLEEAEQAYRRAIGRRSDLAIAWQELGIVLERGNRLDEIETLLEEAEAAGLLPADLALLRAMLLHRRGKPAEALDAARSAPADVEPIRRASLIGTLADRLGDTRAAFAAFADMNRARAQEPGAPAVDPSSYRRHVETLAGLITPDWYGSWTPGAEADGRASPIFLVGFPRSGTTLLDTMLMGHPELQVLEEEPLLQRVEDSLGSYDRLAGLDAGEIASLRKVYFEGLDALGPTPGKRVVDKLPLNILGAPLIHRLFPDARFVLALRHPCDVVLSGFMQDFELNDAMANFLDLEDAAHLYDLVMTFWTRCRDVLPIEVGVVRYERLIDDPESELRSLTKFLGLPWNDGLLHHRRTASERGTIITPSYSQVTEPLYRRAAGRWERYAAEMNHVLPILAPWAERLGYPPADLPA